MFPMLQINIIVPTVNLIIFSNGLILQIKNIYIRKRCLYNDQKCTIPMLEHTDQAVVIYVTKIVWTEQNVTYLRTNK